MGFAIDKLDKHTDIKLIGISPHNQFLERYTISYIIYKTHQGPNRTQWGKPSDLIYFLRVTTFDKLQLAVTELQGQMFRWYLEIIHGAKD